MNSRVIATLEATAQPTFDDMGADEVAIHSASGCDLMIAVEKRSTCRAVHLDRRERLTSAHDREPTAYGTRSSGTFVTPGSDKQPSTGLRASDLVARGFPFGSGQEMTVNIKDRFHHRKLGVGWRTCRPSSMTSTVGCDKPAGDINRRVATMSIVETVEVIVAHNERVTLRVGDVFLKIDADQTHTDIEVEAMALAPIPTPEVLWRKPPVLALGALPGTALGRLGEPSTASSAAWAAAGAAVRMLHDAPLPPWPGQTLDEIASRLDGECEWLLTNGVLPADLVTRNRRVAEVALRTWPLVFAHGDLQITHVLVDGDEITGVIDWSEAGQGDALYDIATLTLGHEERLDDVVAGYGADVDLDVIRGWWSWRSLVAARWLIEHGFDPSSPGAEFDVLRSRM